MSVDIHLFRAFAVLALVLGPTLAAHANDLPRGMEFIDEQVAQDFGRQFWQDAKDGLENCVRNANAGCETKMRAVIGRIPPGVVKVYGYVRNGSYRYVLAFRFHLLKATVKLRSCDALQSAATAELLRDAETELAGVVGWESRELETLRNTIASCRARP